MQQLNPPDSSVPDAVPAISLSEILLRHDSEMRRENRALRLRIAALEAALRNRDACTCQTNTTTAFGAGFPTHEHRQQACQENNKRVQQSHPQVQLLAQRRCEGRQITHIAIGAGRSGAFEVSERFDTLEDVLCTDVDTLGNGKANSAHGHADISFNKAFDEQIWKQPRASTRTKRGRRLAGAENDITCLNLQLHTSEQSRDAAQCKPAAAEQARDSALRTSMYLRHQLQSTIPQMQDRDAQIVQLKTRLRGMESTFASWKADLHTFRASTLASTAVHTVLAKERLDHSQRNAALLSRRLNLERSRLRKVTDTNQVLLEQLSAAPGASRGTSRYSSSNYGSSCDSTCSSDTSPLVAQVAGCESLNQIKTSLGMM